MTIHRHLNAHIRLFIAVLLTGAAPLITQLLGLRFMAAPGYLTAINPPVLVCAAVLAFINARGLMRYELRHAPADRPQWRNRLVFVPVAGIVFATAYLATAVTLPMAYVALTGHETTIRVTAGKQPIGLQRGCRTAVSLAYPHFLYNRLCGVPNVVRESVTRGDVLTLTGRGNGAGIFYWTVSLSDQRDWNAATVRRPTQNSP